LCSWNCTSHLFYKCALELQFQNTILICHIAIFLEFGVVHYAARQMARQKAKHKDDAEFFTPSGDEYFRGTGAGSIRSLGGECRRSEGVAAARSPVRPEHSDGNSGVDKHQMRQIDSGAERRSLRAASGTDTVGSDVQGFSIQEDAAIGMPSVANMLTETLDRTDDHSSCLDLFSRCRRTTREEQEELSELFGSSLAAQGAVRARTWHRFGGTHSDI
jgi:hypothetical protein